MADSTSAGGNREHSVQIPAHGAGQGKAATPEKQLNRFVRAVALIERVGNALGTLAFTWATVVLLGGYPTVLRPSDDFWFATIIVFLEAARMLSRSNNRLDYQLFFNTRGAFRPPGCSRLIVIACFSGVLVILWKRYLMSTMVLMLMAILLAIGRFLSELSSRALKLLTCNPLRRVTSLWSPLVAILLLAPSISHHGYYSPYQNYHDYDQTDTLPRWIVFTILLVAVLMVTISRLRFTRIIKLVDSAIGSKQEIWRQVIMNFCMFAELVMLVFTLHSHNGRFLMIIIEVCGLVIVSFGNLQIPAAVVRVVLALLRLVPQNYDDSDSKGDKTNLKASLDIFYGMVLGQGMLYAVACMLEFFSFIPRRSLIRSGEFKGRSLIRSGEFKGQWGVESVNLYYAHAFEKCMQEGVLAPKKISLCNFAMDSVNSDSSKNQLYGIRMMHSFLQREPTKAQLLSNLTTSTKTMTRIIRMLNWTSPKDTGIRLYAAKVTADLAMNLRVVTIPGTMQLVSALLDADSRPKRGSLLLDTDDEQEERQDSFLKTGDSQEGKYDTIRHRADNQGQRQDQLLDTDNLLGTQMHMTQQVCIDKQNSCIVRCWQRISEFWSIPKEQLLMDHDLLPALAMSIIDSLAGCDQDNCVEISKAADLIPKIIGFTSYISDMTNTEAQQKVLLKSSLKVLQRLTGIGGEIGIILRYDISKHSFLLRNLAEILGDSMSSQESKRLVAGILRNLAVDGNTRQEIGRNQLIITRLKQAFLNAEGTMGAIADRFLRKVAGQALAMLATESAHNSLVMLKEPEFIKTLKTMILIPDGKYIYVAASLLRNLCQNARTNLRESDLKELSPILQKVLEKIMDCEGAELEILIGLSSQICKIIPEGFNQELEDSQVKQRFVKRLVDVLNANMKPSAHCHGIRRVILEQFIYMTEGNSHYAILFNEFRITEALSMVEQTLSKAENYRLFLGSAGLMEYTTPLSSLVARAKELTGYD